MLTLVLGSRPAPLTLTYCRVHQRAWVASLDRWVAFHVPTRDGNPVTDAPCDRCCVQPHDDPAGGKLRPDLINVSRLAVSRLVEKPNRVMLRRDSNT
jgi:hypothetical protein